MENIDIDGVPFSIMMDRAVKLKQLQTKDERLQYDSYPSFYANTIFQQHNVLAARSLNTFNEQLNAAEQMKEEGNAAFREGCLQDALNKYEMALSAYLDIYKIWIRILTGNLMVLQLQMTTLLKLNMKAKMIRSVNSSTSF